MIYSVDVKPTGDELYAIDVTVKDDNGVTLLEGATEVCVNNEQAARDYAEYIFLPDLRNNCKKIASLVLTHEVMADAAISE